MKPSTTLQKKQIIHEDSEELNPFHHNTKIRDNSHRIITLKRLFNCVGMDMFTFCAAGAMIRSLTATVLWLKR